MPTVRGMTGARYCTQSIIAFRNLSAPARMSAIVKALRRSRYAWYAGSARSAVMTNTRASRVLTDGVGRMRTNPYRPLGTTNATR